MTWNVIPALVLFDFKIFIVDLLVMASIESSKSGGGKDKMEKKEKPKKSVTLASTALPLQRVQRIIKKDRDVNKISVEASWAITKASV